MVYIYSRKIQKKDRTDGGLRRIYGMDEETLRKIFFFIKKAPRSRIFHCNGEIVEKITNYLRSRGEFDNFIKRKVKENIQRLQKINSYRGLRHGKRRPVRGQRTHTNAKTCRRVIFGQKIYKKHEKKTNLKKKKPQKIKHKKTSKKKPSEKSTKKKIIGLFHQK